MNLSSIGVTGAGTMGNGIAQICVAAGRLGRKSGQRFFSYS
jgi:3-hydroxyacyl-CoA dehydrogenase